MMRRRKAGEEEEAPGRGSRTGCRAHATSYCTRPPPGSPNRRWTDSRFPGQEGRTKMIGGH